jgi:hypothetical protein
MARSETFPAEYTKPQAVHCRTVCQQDVKVILEYDQGKEEGEEGI